MGMFLHGNGLKITMLLRFSIRR